MYADNKERKTEGGSIKEFDKKQEIFSEKYYTTNIFKIVIFGFIFLYTRK